MQQFILECSTYTKDTTPVPASIELPHLAQGEFARALREHRMCFYVRGTQGSFRNGAHEGDIVRTTPSASRRGIEAGFAEVVVNFDYKPNSAGIIPMKYLYPVPARPKDFGVVWNGHLAGAFVEVRDVAENADGEVQVTFPSVGLDAVYKASDLVRVLR